MKNAIKLLALILITSGCEKPEEIKINEVIHSLYISNRTPLADGNTLIDISVKINPETDADKRNVIFRASTGGFGTTSDTITIQKAIFEGKELIARTKYKVSNSFKTTTFIVQPETRTRMTDYILTDSIKPLFSKPDNITLSPSALGLLPNYAGEVLITATLKNGTANASAKCGVLFEDFLANGNPAGGRYRLKKESTDASSQASTYYAVGNVPPGTNITIRCTYLDEAKNKTNVTATTIITALQP